MYYYVSHNRKYLLTNQVVLHLKDEIKSKTHEEYSYRLYKTSYKLQNVQC